MGQHGGEPLGLAPAWEPNSFLYSQYGTVYECSPWAKGAEFLHPAQYRIHNMDPWHYRDGVWGILLHLVSSITKLSECWEPERTGKKGDEETVKGERGDPLSDRDRSRERERRRRGLGGTEVGVVTEWVSVCVYLCVRVCVGEQVVLQCKQYEEDCSFCCWWESNPGTLVRHRNIKPKCLPLVNGPVCFGEHGYGITTVPVRLHFNSQHRLNTFLEGYGVELEETWLWLTVFAGWIRLCAFHLLV